MSLPCRHFSAAGDGRGGRSQALPAHFVPFSISLKQAQDSFLSWARGQPLAPESLKSLSAIRHTDQAYLPFYVFDVACVSRFGGQVGHDHREWKYNPNTRRIESQVVTRWTRVPMELAGSTVNYPSDLPTCQVYGAFKYKWQHIQVTKSPLTGRVRTPAQMQPSDFAGKEVDVFEMKLETAQGRVLDFVRASEEQRGERVLRQKYSADHVQVEAEVRILELRLRRVYQPAYCFHLEHLGNSFTIMVNGVSGAVSGQYIYSDTKVGLAAVVPTTLIWLWASLGMHLFPLSISSFLFSVVGPSILAGVAGRYWAGAREYMRERKREQDMREDANMAEGAGAQQQWSRYREQQSAGQGDHQRTEQRYEQQYESYQRQRGQQQQQQQQQRQSFADRFRRATPKQTYYDVLGVPRTASLDDIRTAFRAKSFQHHPDVNKGNEKAANDKFREILEAYQTLRDPKKRAEYDRSV